jgi:hypothetical protein
MTDFLHLDLPSPIRFGVSEQDVTERRTAKNITVAAAPQSCPTRPSRLPTPPPPSHPHPSPPTHAPTPPPSPDSPRPPRPAPLASTPTQ